MLARVRAVAARRAARRAARALAQAARRGRARAAAARSCSAAAIGLGVSAAATWFLRTVSDARAAPLPRQGHDRARVPRRAAAGVGGDDRPPRAARLPRPAVGAARPGVRARPHVHVAVLDLRLDPAARRHDRAARVDPPGAGRCSRCSRCRRCSRSTWRPAVERAAQERGAQADRLARHLFTTATTAPPGKEVRVTGIGERLAARAPRGLGALVRAGGGGALGLGARGTRSAWAVFGGALRRRGRLRRRPGLDAPAGDVLLVLAAGSRLSAYIGATVGEIGFLRGIWIDGSRRLAWLEDYAAVAGRAADAGAGTARTGIRFEHVSFAYPGTIGSCSTTCRSRCRPARSSPSSARTARARRRW